MNKDYLPKHKNTTQSLTPYKSLHYNMVSTDLLKCKAELLRSESKKSNNKSFINSRFNSVLGNTLYSITTNKSIVVTSKENCNSSPSTKLHAESPSSDAPTSPSKIIRMHSLGKPSIIKEQNGLIVYFYTKQ